MEDMETAKFIIGTLLDQPVVTIDAKSQELSYYTPEENAEKHAPLLRLMRLDFVATILTETGEYKKALIEMQKAFANVDIMRFRNYLAEEYKREDATNGRREILPVVTIYILGDAFPDIETACVRINRRYYDAVHKTFINARNYFIELLTHDSVVVQTPKIESDRYQTKLDKLLSVFEQKYFIDEKEIYKDYKHVIDNENIRRIIDILHYCASEVEERKLIEAEHEAWRVYYALLKNELEKVNKQAVTIAEKDIIIAENAVALAQKNAALAQKDVILAEKEAELIHEQEEKKRILAEKEKLLAELQAIKGGK
jgi:predicted DNA binding protein